ncbi:Morn repeat protein [Pandoravirus inopinatum]|uniref:Morn repeat protein n=1 Tax=Pandoravirus inopinatum TaxID=1605721 RepID=A0A0B5JDJ6_9VIRU|nr:Morn repeat protein [Pandoravirus inopinatum]AJF97797.1 Morn repeat protein [Pandoravirus inopinatum]
MNARDTAGQTLDDMPYEILLAVAKATDSVPAVVRLGLTCRRCSSILDDDSLWKALCWAHFGPPLREGSVDVGKDWRWLYRAQGHVASTKGPDVGAVMMLGRIYWGDTLDGLPHGYGLSLALPTPHRDGQKLTRRTRDTALDQTAPRHDGYWGRGCEHGYGVRVHRNGSRYRGMWRNCAYHGYGERFDIHGWHYAGHWYYGHCHDDDCSDDRDGSDAYGCPDIGSCVEATHDAFIKDDWRRQAANLMIGPLWNRAAQCALVGLGLPPPPPPRWRG